MQFPQRSIGLLLVARNDKNENKEKSNMDETIKMPMAFTATHFDDDDDNNLCCCSLLPFFVWFYL